MKRTTFRLTQRRYAETAYSGVSSLHRNGRWHRAGIPMVYAAESPAVALLEVLVHLERPRLMTMELAIVPCTFDDGLMEAVEDRLRPHGLPPDWRTFPWPESTQRIGMEWFHARSSVVLDVPSAVMPSARNYLLNPTHPDFERVLIQDAEAFEIDPRLGN